MEKKKQKKENPARRAHLRFRRAAIELAR